MEKYVVSARKYRPVNFESVVGQSSLTTTLKNAIRNNQIAHAYLFCGPRGVGKTTCARIFAKTINCSNITPEGEACDKCESCKSFNDQRSVNIFELDAASNNSVEDIRQLIEEVRIPPQMGKYKVYIIDEVHMLSNTAFNAFLKTLEEPPAHAIFIMATTEKHKILPTILSRCQIYDFNRITVNDIVLQLKKIAEKENIKVDDNALNIIATKADGGMRDALSIFDQVANFGEGNVTYENVIYNLNVLDYDYYFKITDDIYSGDYPAALLIFNDILNNGFEGQNFIDGLSSHFRDLLMCKNPGTAALLETGADIREKYINQAKTCSTPFIYTGLRLCNECSLSYKNSRNKRLIVELCLIRLSQLSDSKKKIREIINDEIAPIKPINDNKKEKQTQKGTVKKDSSTLSTNKTEQNKARKATADSTKNATIKEDNKSNNSPTNKKFNISSIYTGSINYKYGNNEKGTDTQETDKNIQENNLSENMDFSYNELLNKWKDFISTLKEDIYLSNSLASITPELTDKTKVEIFLPNEHLLQNINSIKQKLCDFLQAKLHNTDITITTSLREKEDDAFHPYTTEEKKEFMVKNNPNLQKLIDKFGLTIE